MVAAFSEVTYQIRRGRKRPSIVKMDRLWRYHGPGRYSWGHGEREDDISPSSGKEDMTDADQDVDENLGGDGDATDVNGDPELGLGTGDAPLSGTAYLLPATPPLLRSEEVKGKPRKRAYLSTITHFFINFPMVIYPNVFLAMEYCLSISVEVKV